ncbi:TPA: hypothetical protein ACH3X2_001553 [Trebouxia sp. C0005]
MKAHLQYCDNVSDKVRAWDKDWSKASEPFADNTADSPEASGPRQSGMQRFLPLKDTPMTNKDQDSFEMALLKGTISANLPFTCCIVTGQPEKKPQVVAGAASSSQKRHHSESQPWTWTH